MLHVALLLATLTTAAPSTHTLATVTVADSAQSGGVQLVSLANGGLEVSHDGGASFVPVAAPRSLTRADAPAIIATLLALDGGSILAVDELGRVFRSDDGGSQWADVSDGLPVPFSRRMPPVDLVSAGEHVLAVVREPLDDARDRTMLYRSDVVRDGTSRWQAVKELAAGVDDVRVSIEAGSFLVDADGLPVAITAEPVAWASESAYELPPAERLTSDIVPPADFISGGIQVLYDDGTLVPTNDYAGRELRFAPNGDGSYETWFSRPGGVMPFGDDLRLGEDQTALVELPFPFPFFGQTHTQVFISENGNLTLGSEDTEPDALESDVQLAFGPPRIAALWDDLSSAAGGQVLYYQLADSVRITWSMLGQFGDSDPSSFQVELFDNGDIVIRWDILDLPKDGLVGISPGGGAGRYYTDITRDAPFTTPQGAAVYEQFRGDEVILERALPRLLHCQDDVYDQVVVWGSAAYPDGIAGGVSSSHRLVSNDVTGIGRPVFDHSRRYGSGGRLQSVINMDRAAAYAPDPSEGHRGTRSALDVLAHETARRWAGWVRFDDGGVASDGLLAPEAGTWSFFFDAEASVLGGHGFRDRGDGSFLSEAATERFATLDRYLMGVLDAVQVPEFGLLENVVESSSCGGAPCTAGSDPVIGATFRAERHPLTVDAVAAVEGLRVPARGPTEFRQAWVLIVPAGHIADLGVLDQLEQYRAAWEVYFAEATSSLASMDTQLEPPAPVPVGTVGNTLQLVRSGNDVVLEWSSRNVTPRRYNVHGTADKGFLGDTADGIAATPVILQADHETIADPWAVNSTPQRPSPYFYEVHPRDCANVTVLP